MIEDGQSAAGKPTFVGKGVQIGAGFGGMKPVAQNGQVVIADGTLVLYGSKGQVINQSPVGGVTVKANRWTMKSVVMVTLANGTRYSLGIGAGGVALLAPGAFRLGAGLSGGKAFTAALEHEQQRGLGA